MVETVVVDFGLTQITTIITTVALVGGLIFGAVRWMTQQAEKKALAIKEKAEHTAAELKITTDDIRQETKEFTISANLDLKHLIESVDSKVAVMLTDLRKRADLTNGNVAMIRTDIADLQEDLSLIQDALPAAVAATGGGSASVADYDRNETKRLRDRKRRDRRRQIEADRVSQSERVLSRDG